MSIRTKVLGMVDVMMRVPPILVIDEILKIGMGLPSRSYTDKSVDKGGGVGDLSSFHHQSSNNSVDMAAGTDSITNFDMFTQITNASLEKAIDNASTAAIAGGVLSSSFGNLIDELAKDSYLSDLLSITSIKFVICVLGKLHTYRFGKGKS